MAWDDLLLPASFRGIPFFVESHEKNGGRNAVSHEPPDRESSFAEDMGKKADGYSVRGHVLGDTYFFIRDALVTAMETKESGVLIHPYLGFIDVQPQGYTFSEDTKEGRICRFELNFVEAGDPSIVGDAFDIITGFVGSVVAGIAQVENAFAVAAVFSGLPGFAITSSVSLFQGFITSVGNSLSKFALNIEELPTLLADLADLDLNKRSLLLNDPNKLVQDTDNIIRQLKDVVFDEKLADTETVDTSKDKPAKIAIYDDILDYTEEVDDTSSKTFTVSDSSGDLLISMATKHPFAVGAKIEVSSDGALPGGLVAGISYFVIEITSTTSIKISTTSAGASISFTDTGTGIQTLTYDSLLDLKTATRIRELKNGQAISRMIRQLALFRVSEAAADITFNSIDAGVGQRDAINDLFDEQMSVSDIDDNLFQALNDQKASNVNLIPNPSQSPGTIKVLDIISTQPSLVIVYNFYGNVKNEVDVLDRNRIMNPAFVDGEIEVLSFG